MCEISHWHYINTKTNPADFASRGLLPSELKNNELWWHGPSVLLNEKNCAPEKIETREFETQMEEKKMKMAIHTASVNMDCDIINKFSSLNRAIRTIAFCKRYLNELRKKKQLKSVITNTKEACEKQCLSIEELENAKMEIIKSCQEKYFSKDIQKSKEGGVWQKIAGLSLYIHLTTDTDC